MAEYDDDLSLKECFLLQEEFMEILRDNDKIPEWPVDLRTKPGQRMVKEIVFNMIEELAEASFTLKNRMHRLSDDREFDFSHYKEELGDAFAYFLEVCIMSGISAEDLFDEYVRKNKIVRDRVRSGY